jgi:hypothetical protein
MAIAITASLKKVNRSAADEAASFSITSDTAAA